MSYYTYHGINLNQIWLCSFQNLPQLWNLIVYHYLIFASQEWIQFWQQHRKAAPVSSTTRKKILLCIGITRFPLLILMRNASECAQVLPTEFAKLLQIGGFQSVKNDACYTFLQNWRVSLGTVPSGTIDFEKLRGAALKVIFILWLRLEWLLWWLFFWSGGELNYIRSACSTLYVKVAFTDGIWFIRSMLSQSD